MNSKIPFTRDIQFGKKISEITSISLEHEIKVDNNILKGNCTISGDYKSHEVSINKEAFSYSLPFDIALSDEIDPNTIEFMIDDFTYEIVDNTNLRVNIDFNVIANLKEKEEILSEDNRVISEDNEIKNEELVNEVTEVPNEEPKEKEEAMKDDTIINSINNITEDEYATYHIHMVSDGETIETICTMYNSNMNILSDYNDLNNIVSGDKIIIPESNE